MRLRPSRLLCSLALFIAGESRAFIGLGTFDPAIHEYQTDLQGGHGWISINPTILFNHHLYFWGDLAFAPEAGYAFHRRLESGYHKDTAFLVYDLAWNIGDSGSLLRAGLATFYTRIGGPGGTSDRMNGDETVSFYLADATATSIDGALNLGFEQRIGPHYSVKAEAFCRRFTNSNRTWASLISVNYLL
jgi:hypothetical protein